MRTVLTIGRESDNDFVIALPVVSGHHARLTWEGVPGQALLEDLGSSNGTAIGQLDRKLTRATLSATDTVFFGNHSVPATDLLEWVDPSLAPVLVLKGAELVVGRDAGCHRVFDRPTISGRHARIKRSGDKLVLEDLGSSNGTFVNGRRVQGSAEVQVGDMIGLGADTFRLSTDSAPVRTQRIETLRPPQPSRGSATTPVGAMPSGSRAGATRRVSTSSELRESLAPAWAYPATLGALVAQAPILAIAIGAIGGKSPATALFALGLAVLWFGLSTAVFGFLADPKRPEWGWDAEHSGIWMARLLLLAGLCVVECVLAEAIVFPMAGLKGSGLAAFGLLVQASGIGLAAGSLIVLLGRRPPVAWGALAAALLALALLGGGPWSLPRTAWPVRMASNAAPSRWAFEGLLVSESDTRAVDSMAGGKDLAEEYFPIEADRMGPRADAMALASMLIGGLGLGLFVVTSSEPGRGSPSRP